MIRGRAALARQDRRTGARDWSGDELRDPAGEESQPDHRHRQQRDDPPELVGNEEPVCGGRSERRGGCKRSCDSDQKWNSFSHDRATGTREHQRNDWKNARARDSEDAAEKC